MWQLQQAMHVPAGSPDSDYRVNSRASCHTTGKSWQTLARLIVEAYINATCARKRLKHAIIVTAGPGRPLVREKRNVRRQLVMLATTLQLQDLGLNFTRQCMHPSHPSRSLSFSHWRPSYTKFIARSPLPSSSLFSFSSCLRHMPGLAPPFTFTPDARLKVFFAQIVGLTDKSSF